MVSGAKMLKTANFFLYGDHVLLAFVSVIILLIIAEIMCNLRGETSRTPLDITDKVRTYSGVPLIVSFLYELH